MEVTADDLEYYERRAREEAAAAASTDRVEIAAAHRLLALQYEGHLEDIRTAQARSQNRETGVAQTHRPFLTVRQAQRDRLIRMRQP